MIQESVENINYAPMPQDFLRTKRATPFLTRPKPQNAVEVDADLTETYSVCDCCDFNKVFTLPVLADDGSEPLENDYSSFLFEAGLDTSSVTYTLQQWTGLIWTDVVASLDGSYGTVYPLGIFDDYPLFMGYRLEWYLVLAAFGEGNYRVKFTATGLGGSETTYSGMYCLKQYSAEAADRTVRFEWTNNGYISNADYGYSLVNFGNINWQDMIRLTGAFGFPTDEEEIVDVNYFDGNELKAQRIRNLTNHKYRFASGYYPAWVHSILKNYAFKSNDLNVTNYGRLDKHSYERKAILKEANGYKPEYGHVYKKWYKVSVDFRDKYEDVGFRKNCQPSGQNCSPVTIKDSNGNVLVEVPSGSTYVNTGVTCTPISELSCAELNNVNTLPFSSRNFIQAIQPTKSGLTVSFNSGDDGDLEIGRGVDFFTLDCNNGFGNTNRFTDSLGTQIYADNLILDWQTRLMWYRVPISGTWTALITSAQSSTQGGFTDWEMPNISQLISISNFDNSQAASALTNYSPFNVNITGSSQRILSSTTNRNNTAGVFALIEASTFISAAAAKSIAARTLICRLFIPSDVGL